MIYLAVGTNAAWSALSPAEQAKYTSHHTTLQSAELALPATPLDHYTIEGISGISNATLVPMQADFNGFDLIIDFSKYTITSSYVLHDIVFENITNYGTVTIIVKNIVFSVTKSTAFYGLVNVDNSTLNLNLYNTVLDGNSGTLIRWGTSTGNLNIYNNDVHNAGRGFHIFSGTPTCVMGNNTVVNASDTGFRMLADGTKTLYNNYADGPAGNSYVGTFTDGGGNASSDTTAPNVLYQNITPVAAFVDPGTEDYTPITDGPLKIGVAPTISGHTTYLDSKPLVAPYYSGAYGPDLPVSGVGGSGRRSKYNWGWSMSM